MARMTLRAEGTANIDEAWDRYADTRRWSQWSPQIRSVTTSDGPMIAPDSTGSVGTIFGPRVTFVITDVDPVARTWHWVVRLPWAITLQLTHAVTPAPTGCATSLEIRGPLPIIVGYAPIAQLALTRLVRK